MAEDSFDLANVKALLSSRNPIIQSNGLTCLLSRLRLPFPNAKEKVSASSLFFDGFTKYGDAVTQWCADAVPCLLSADIITIEDVNTHCFVKLCNSGTRRTSRIILIRLLLQLSQCLPSTCLEIVRKCTECSDLVVSELISQDFDKCFPALKMLLVSRILSEELDIIILHHIYINADSDDLHIGQLLEYLPWKFSRHFITKFKLRHIVANLLSHCTELSHRELQSLELSVEDVFLIAENVLVNPLLVMNELFPACHVLLPALISLYSSRSELAKSFPSLIPSEQLSKIKAVIAHCQKVRPLKTVVLEDNWSGCMSTFTYLEYVSNASNITTFTDLWLSNLDSTEVSLSSITLSTALLPYCNSSFKKCSTLLIGLLNRSPEHVNCIFLFLTALYAKPFFQVDRPTILHFMRGLLVHKFIVTPAINFLSIVCRQHGEERDIAFSLIQDLVTKFPTTFDAVKNLAIPGESDCLDLLKLKLKLMSTLCVSTDRSDELLPSLTRLLKKSADVVGVAVPVVIILCKEEILDINSVRKQLGIMVRQPGFEVALMGYCEILAAAATQSEKCDDSLSVEYVQELWEITQLRKDSSDGEDARRRAWTALGSFDFHLLESAIPLSGRRLVGQFLGLRQTERKGFAIFLHKIVSAEVESLSRSLYTRSHIRKTLLAPLVCNLHNSLGRTNQEAPWFWLATLPLFSVIVNGYSESEMKLQAFKLLRRLLREVPLVENKLVNLFAGWRICISTFLNMETKGDNLLRCRDKIIEECKRSLKENELAANNVIVVIAVLAGEMLRGRTEKSDSKKLASDFDASMRIWTVSALEFLFPLVFDGYKRRSNPLLLIHVNSRCVNVPLVRSAVWMICSLISNEIKNFYEDVEFNSIMKWRLGIEERQDENLHNFLAGEEFCAEISLSRSALWLLAAALGAEELVVNSLSYSIPSDNSAEESIALFCSENTIEPVDISRVLSQTSNVTLNVFRKYERNFKKRLQQFSLNGGEESKRIIYEGLSHLSSISLLTNSIDLPSDYSHLPDDSVLRAVIEQFSAKSACNRVILHDMLPVLVDHVRSDGRHLPPLDLKIVLSAIDYRNNHEARLNMLRFAIQERDQQVMYELTEPGYLDDSANVSPYLLSISQNLPLFLSFLPNSRAVMVLKRLLKFAIQDDDVGKQILVNIDECGQQQVVFDVLVTHMPLFESPTDLLHKVTSLKAIDERFKQQVSGCFDFWLACSGRIDSELSGLVEMFVEESAKSDIMLCIFGYCSMSLTLKERLDKLVNLMSFGKVMLSKRDSAGKIDSLLKLFLALLCSAPADIPLHWLSSDIQSLLFARWRYHWKTLSNICQFCELFDMIADFLSACFLIDGLSASVVSTVKGMMLYISTSRPTLIRPLLEGKSERWEKLLTL